MIIYTYLKWYPNAPYTIDFFNDLYSGFGLDKKDEIIPIQTDNGSIDREIVVSDEEESIFICNETKIEHDVEIIEFCKKIGKNRINIGYECPLLRESDFQLFDHFDIVFTNYNKIVDNVKFFWIPCYMWRLTYELVEFPKYHWKYDDILCRKFVGYLNENKKNDGFIINNPIGGRNVFRDYLCMHFLRIANEKSLSALFYGPSPYLRENCICYNNNDTYDNDERYKQTFDIFLKKTIVLNKFKFVIVIENRCDAYTSEKLANVLLCDVIPIYFGTYNIDVMFPDLFRGVINGYKYPVDGNDFLIALKEITDIKKDSPRVMKYIDIIITKLRNMCSTEYDEKLQIIKDLRYKYTEMYLYRTCIEYAFKISSKVLFDKQIQMSKIQDDIIDVNKRLIKYNSSDKE